MSPGEALALIERQADACSATDDPPALVVLPHPLDGYVLAYRATMRNLQTWFLDAHRGAIVHAESVMDEQTAVGVGAGIGGQRKKVIASQAGASFQTYDRLRPAEIVTLDLRYDDRRADDLLDPRGPEWTPSDVASDADNDWDDPAVVDGHAHTGFTYDYLFRRHALLRQPTHRFASDPHRVRRRGAVGVRNRRPDVPLRRAPALSHGTDRGPVVPVHLRGRPIRPRGTPLFTTRTPTTA